MYFHILPLQRLGLLGFMGHSDYAGNKVYNYIILYISVKD